MKHVIWAIHEIRYLLAKWRADRHIARTNWHISRTNAMIRIMNDACDRQKSILEAGE